MHFASWGDGCEGTAASAPAPLGHKASYLQSVGPSCSVRKQRFLLTLTPKTAVPEFTHRGK